MATKDLARSVIEGGRYFHNTFFRRESHRTVRTRARERLDEARADVEAREDVYIAPRGKVGRMFRDKLSPAYRFLDSRIGKSWNKTRALIAEPRTTTTRRRRVLSCLSGNTSTEQKCRRVRCDDRLQKRVCVCS